MRDNIAALLQSPVPHVIIGRDHRITYWSSACEGLTGLAAKDKVGTDTQWNPFYPAPTPTLADLVLDHAPDLPATDGSGNIITRRSPDEEIWECWLLLSAANSSHYLHCMAALVRDAKGRVFGAVQAFYDATEQRLREIELFRSQRDYAAIAETFPEGFLVVQDGLLVLVNRIYANFLGYQSPEELIGRPAADYIAESHREAFLQHLEDLSAGRKPLCLAHWPHLKRNGEIIWLEGHPRLMTWCGAPASLSMLIDYTEHYQRQAGPLLENETPVEDRYRLGRIVGKSPAIRMVYSRVLKAAASGANVLITGESGTGKEVVARTIHELSSRKDKPFVAVNCGAIPAELLESMFFGYKKGSFTGAYEDHPGFLDQADTGCLFLDEVGDLPLGMQVKFLRFLDNNGYCPLGSRETRNADVRVIAATNRDLRAMLQAGTIREDFYYRLYIIPITLPPLRKRKEDIPLLVDEFLANTPQASGKRLPGFILDALIEHDWPGNVRELQNTLQRFFTLGILDIGDHAGLRNAPLQIETTSRSMSEQRVDLECRLVLDALQRCQGDRTAAAAALGISRRTLYRRLHQCQKWHKCDMSDKPSAKPLFV